MPTPTTWRSWHLHISDLSVGASDDVLRRVVHPARDGRPEPWFFLRYWQHGPHIRLRVANLDVEGAARLDEELRRRLDQLLGSAEAPLTADEYRRYAAPLAAAGEGGEALEVGELWAPGVYAKRYEPERARYGGDDVLALSESLFHHASRLAMAFVRRGAPEAARSGLGLQATRAALGILGDEERRRTFCRRAGAGWQAWAARAGGLGDEGNYAVPGAPATRKGPAAPPVQQWVDQLDAAMTLWRDATNQPEAERILHSHIHMLHNRLGLSVRQEHLHYRALETAR